MADLRESFPSLEIDGTTEGAALTSRVEGDAAAAKRGSIGFSFKDSSGQCVLPSLNSSGQISVTSEIAGDNLKNRGENAAGSGTLVTIASITLTASKVYQGPEIVVSCFRDSLFQLIHSDNAVETVLCDAIVGPGAFTAYINLDKLEFTAGATGVQLLLVKALNQNSLSALRATVAIKQLP